MQNVKFVANLKKLKEHHNLPAVLNISTLMR